MKPTDRDLAARVLEERDTWKLRALIAETRVAHSEPAPPANTTILPPPPAPPPKPERRPPPTMKTTNNAAEATLSLSRAALRANPLATRAWRAHDPHAKPTHAITLRLNDYQLELLQAVVGAITPRVSQQSVLRRIVVRGLERAAASE